MAEANGSAQPNGTGKVAARNTKGQFLKGHRSIGGRPLGSRNKLAEKFLDDLQRQWRKSGKRALERTAEEDPVAFTKIVASLMPRQLISQANVNVDISLFNEARDFKEAFGIAKSYLNLDAEEPLMIEAEAEPEDEDAIAAIAGTP